MHRSFFVLFSLDSLELGGRREEGRLICREGLIGQRAKDATLINMNSPMFH